MNVFATSLRACVLALATLVAIASGFDVRAPRPVPGAPFTIAFDGAPGMFYTVEGSTNLLSWDVLRSLRASGVNVTWADTNAPGFPTRYYRIADLSDLIVVEGRVGSPDGRGVPDNCPFCDILVSSSLDGNTAYTDYEGHYVLRTTAASVATNLPFTLYFSKIGFRAHSAFIMNPALPRIDLMTLTGPSNNDFTNRTVVSGAYTNQGNNAVADVEHEEPGNEPSVWYSFTAPENGTLRFAIDTTDFLPAITFFRGESMAELQAVRRGIVSNYVEWRIEVTHDLTVYAGEQLQIRVGALEHPTRGIQGGDFEARCLFERDFPLAIEALNTNFATVVANPLPNASGRYASGTQVQVSAIPASNYVFLGWTGSVEDNNSSIIVTMDEAKTLVPHFRLANGSIGDAVVITNGYPRGEGWIGDDQVLWYSWTPSRLTPLNVGFESTNYFHAQVYRLSGTNLVFVTNTAREHLRSTRLWGSNGVTYLFTMYLEKNQSGYCRFSSMEPIVVQGAVRGPYSCKATTTFPNSESTASWNVTTPSAFEIWTGLRYSPESYPYTLTITEPGYRPVSASIYANGDVASFAPPFSGPSNNDFTNRIGLLNASGKVSGSVFRAESEPGESGLGRGSVWYQFTPPSDGTLQLVTTTFSATNVTVWSGVSLDVLMPRRGWVLDVKETNMTTEWSLKGAEPCQIRISGATNNGLGFALSYAFTPGYPLLASNAQPQAGSIQVTPAPASGRYAPGSIVVVSASALPGYRFRDWTGDVSSTNNPLTITMNESMRVQANFAVINDDLANAYTISGLPVSATGLNLYGTAEPEEPAHGGFPAAASVWWSWTAPTTVDVQVNFDFDLPILAAVYTGVNVSHLVSVANNTAGRNIRQIRFKAFAEKTYWLSVDAYNAEGGPFSFAIEPVSEARYILSTGPSDGGYAVADPLPDGNTEYGSGQLVRLRAEAVNAWKFAGWDDVSTGRRVDLGTNLEMFIEMVADRRVLPRFIAPSASRLNDNFADRLILLTANDAVFANNSFATVESGEPGAATNASGRSVWFSWTAGQTAPVAFSTAGSQISNVLAAYTGDNLTSLVAVASDAGGAGKYGSQISFVAEAGVTYHISIDGLGGASGLIRLRGDENEQFTLDVLSPTNGQCFAAPAAVALHLQALNSDLSVTQIDVSVPELGSVSLTNLGSDVIYSNVPSGKYSFSATARDAYGRVVSSSGRFFVHRYQFSTTSIAAYPRDGVARFNITRSNPIDVASSVYFDLFPGSAVDSVDYARCSGAITFLKGETNCFVTIPLAGGRNSQQILGFTASLSSGPDFPPAHVANVTLADYDSIGFLNWIDDAFPDWSIASAGFAWISADPAPLSGALARESLDRHEYLLAGGEPMLMGNGEVIWQDVYLDPAQAPGLLSIAWKQGPYYRQAACWGARELVTADHGTWLGPLPVAGHWTQLKIPANLLGMFKLTGMEWSVVGGRAVWDRTGKQWK